MHSVGLGLILAVLAGAAASCGGGNGGPRSSASQALWVPNFDGDFVSVFTSKMLKKSGTPDRAGVNLSSALNEPFGEVFDSSKNLWVSNVG
jgi:hypothetical protein